jgi:Trk K+ transport system NAD-binding subunit
METIQPAARPAAHALRRRYSLWRLARANLYDLWLLIRESWGALTGFMALMLAGSLYLVVTTDLSFVEALYATLKLLTFEGGDQLPPDALGRVLFFLIPLLGLALILQSVLNFGRLLLDKGSRREAWQIALASTCRDHVIVCGLGRVGLRVVTQLLEAGYEPVVVERDWESRFVEQALRLKLPVVLGDAREPAVLRQAGLSRARAVVVSINDDLLNIEIALTVRAERPGIRVVLRVFNEELDQNLERSFGSNSAFSTSALGAPTFAAATISREIDYVLPVAGKLLGVTRHVIRPGSRLCGITRDVERQHGIRVLVHQAAGGTRPQRAPARRLGPADRVVLIGALDALDALHLHDLPAAHKRPAAKGDTVIVCGLGRVGYRVVQQLHQLDPRPRIVVIRQENTAPEFLRTISRLEGVTTIVGDARDAEVLRAAGIDAAHSVAALTSNDLANLQIGLAVRRQRPDVRLVLRVFSDTLAEKLADMFGIHTAYSTSALASATLAAAAVLGDVGHAFFAGGRLFSTDRLVVRPGDWLDGRSVATIREQHDALVIGLRRGGETLVLPSIETVVAPGDELTLLASLDALASVRAALPRPAAAGTPDAATV